MRFRGVCTLIALASLLWTSGCCWDHCCCRRHHERACGCGCAASCYTPSCGRDAAPPFAPPLAGPVGIPVSSGPVMPMPTPLMPPGGGR